MVGLSQTHYQRWIGFGLSPRLPSFVAAVIALFGLAACDGRFGEAKRLVRATLTDPQSAQFESLRQGKDDKTVCGLVNSRNRFGGYDGRRRFYAELGSRSVQVEPDGELSPAAREMFGDGVLIDRPAFDRLYEQKC